MIDYSELIRVLNRILSERYPRIRRYGNDTTEGWHKPYFFIECVPYESNYKTRNFAEKSCSMKITYFQESDDEEDQLRKAGEIREAVGMKFAVAGRSLDVRDYTHDYVGEYNNILQISFRFGWFENLYREPEGERIDDVDVAIKKGEP